MPPPAYTVVLAQAEAEPDHFAGLDAALAARSLACDRLYADGAPVRLDESVRVVVIKDQTSFVARYALEQATRVGAVAVLLMDGIVEWRNTFINPGVAPSFLRPAPADVIACAGDMDARTLRALGNEAVPTGLPRLAAMRTVPRPPRRGAILVATANTPAFTPDERTRLLRALTHLRDRAAARGVELLWRLTGGLDTDLGVMSDRRSLPTAMAEAAAVITAPSTLLVEAMLAGRPTALLDPHPTPRWQVAPWLWHGPDPVPSCPPTLPGAEHADLHADLRPLARTIHSADDLLTELLAPTSDALGRQAAILTHLHAQRPAAEALADLCRSLARTPHKAAHPKTLPSPARSPARLPAIPGRPRVVNLVYCDGSPVGGVQTWALRLARAFAQQPTLGFDVRTLLVTPHPDALPAWAYDPDGLTHACVFDPFADHAAILRTVRAAAEALDPSILVPNYTDVTYMTAMQLRARGVRTLAVAHTDHAYYRDLIGHYHRWDTAVSVSSACAAWLRPLAKDRPHDTIVYGVPIADSPRTPPPTGPLRIVYCGRMVQEQKRIFDLLEVIDALEALGAPYELHMVGDGPDLPAWRRELSSRTLEHGRVECHGRREPAWVEAFLPTIDVSLLVSDYEGTSVSMLEAMGAGVVPAVTRVSSGVDDWLTGGGNAVVVPPRQPVEMARRLARLAKDRSLLAPLGRAAWETARRAAGLPAMARRYADLFRRALAAPMDAAPTDLGLRPLELWRWKKGWADDPDAAETWARAGLYEAGYSNIAQDRPAPGCDAVLVRTDRAEVGEDEVASWRARGLGVAFAPHVRRDVPGDALRRTLDAAVREGAKRIAVFGAGKHTRRMAPVFYEGHPIVAFIDDAPPSCGHLYGRPVVPLARIDEYDPDTILLSSDAFEPQMWRRCAPLRARGVRVIPLYGHYADEPVPA